ncbi:hypothetical protein CDD82_6774 [Ophiocordyceps australis]|uniref:Uncharacterized protein n=1 Tax=Ophiocordyceps australis TaxID=1399860 RepID=A0A2C5XFZ9_9HYPO|nr:hypothetical protein CDD82_6774 [Ophiocordyceps australis]
MDQDTDRFPLHTAAREGNPNSVQTDPSLAKSKDADGRYPIHWAASSNCHAIALVLANERGFDPDVQDASGWTPLMISASIADSEPMLRLFLQKDANVDEKSMSTMANPSSYNM